MSNSKKTQFNIKKIKEHFSCTSAISLLILGATWLTPNLLLIHYQPTLAVKIKAVISFIIFIIWATAHTSTKRTIRWSIPIFLLIPFDIFYILRYHEPPTTHIIPSLVETNPTEALDFIRGHELTLSMLTMSAALAWLAAYTLAGHNEKTSKPNQTARFSQSLLATIAFLMILIIFPKRLPDSINESRITKLTTSLLESGPLKLKTVFPVGPIISLAEYLHEESIIASISSNRSDLPKATARPIVENQREIYLLVIGETGRRDRMGIHGYKRDTNPKLSKINGIHPLSDVISPWTLTNYSVPTILSLSNKFSLDNPRMADPNQSAIRLFRQAGFKTYWLSNQPTFGAAESTITRFGRIADEWHFVNPSNNAGFGNGTYDEEILPHLDRIIAKGEQRQFIVIHLLGSHDSYHRRYPKHMNHFQPSLSDMNTEHPDHHDANLKTAVNNAYDNSIRYTDHVLSEIINRVGITGSVAGLTYVADHGESLFDGDCLDSGHGGNSYYEYPVASFIWLSEEYARVQSESVNNIKRNGSMRMTTQNISPAVLGMAGIKFDDIDPSMDPFSMAFSEHQRNVMAGSRIDWDSAQPSGTCHALISRPPSVAQVSEK